MTARIWNLAFDILMYNEGGYVNDSKDPGGETKYGICKRSYPELDIKNLTLDKAKEIYHQDYWRSCKCDYLPDCLSVAVFDYAVNSGTMRAIKDLQASLGVTVDGIIGNQTIGAANRVPLKPVLEDLHNRRMTFLMGLKDWKRYGEGWGTRAVRVKNFCKELI